MGWQTGTSGLALAIALAWGLGLVGGPAARALEFESTSGAFGFSSTGQPSTEVRFRAHVWGPLDVTLGSINREQRLSSDRTYALQTDGFAASLGLQDRYLRAGLGMELGQLHRLTDLGGTGQLAWDERWMAFAEPFVGIHLPLPLWLVSPLPFLKGPLPTGLELTFHLPLNAPDGAIGPRVMLSWWVAKSDWWGDRPIDAPDRPRLPAPLGPAPAPAPTKKGGPAGPPSKPNRAI